jgi:hypothetical protein
MIHFVNRKFLNLIGKANKPTILAVIADFRRREEA